MLASNPSLREKVIITCGPPFRACAHTHRAVGRLAVVAHNEIFWRVPKN